MFVFNPSVPPNYTHPLQTEPAGKQLKYQVIFKDRDGDEVYNVGDVDISDVFYNTVREAKRAALDTLAKEKGREYPPTTVEIICIADKADIIRPPAFILWE